MHLVEALKKEGHEVVVFDIKLGHDICNKAHLAEAFKGATYVFHTAALPRLQYSIDHPYEAHHVNVDGTFMVLLAARDAGVQKVVYSASSSAYGDQPTLPLVESMQVDPKSPYGLQKYIGELNARMMSKIYNLPTVSLRYFNVYGPGGDVGGAYALLIPKFIARRLAGEPLLVYGDGEQTRDFTHVRDVVRANILAAESPNVGKGEVINIGAGNNVSINRIAQLIGGPVEHTEARLEPRDTLADNTLAKQLFGWEPHVTIEEGIAELKKLAGLV